MNTTLTGKNRIFEIYRTLAGPVTDFTQVNRVAETALFQALGGIVNEILPVVNTDVHIMGDYFATPQEEAAMLAALSAFNLGEKRPVQIGSDTVSLRTEGIKVLVLYYEVSALFDEVYKRTSYIARSRRDKETKEHLLDLVALTKDDESVFNPFLRDASNKILEAFAPFNRELSSAFLYQHVSGILPVIEGTTYQKGARVLSNKNVYELTGAESNTVENGFDNADWTLRPPYLFSDDKVVYLAVRPSWTNDNMIDAIDTAVYEATVSHIMARWFTIVLPEEAAVYYNEASVQMRSVVSQLNSNNRPMGRKHRMF